MKFSIGATLVRAFIAWLLILGLAIGNGVLREAVLVPALGARPGLMLSGAILSACVLAVALLFAPRLGAVSRRRGLAIGIFWLVLTLGFEFGFGRAVAHKTWAQLLEAYTFRDGNLWPLVLLVIVFAPLFAAWLRRRHR
ncbi:MAG TPA: hypothetical protein PKC97_04370 [Burkholderiaceae bacterium]|jgi:hypothetical protein|nr:hypothetical protein [Burkholderiaceae bacterium]